MSGGRSWLGVTGWFAGWLDDLMAGLAGGWVVSCVFLVGYLLRGDNKGAISVWR